MACCPRAGGMARSLRCSTYNVVVPIPRLACCGYCNCLGRRQAPQRAQSSGLPRARKALGLRAYPCPLNVQIGREKQGRNGPPHFFLKMPLPLREVSMNASPWPSETQYPLIGRHLRVRWQVRECRTSGQANRFSTCSPRKGLRRVCPKTNSGKGLKPASLFRGRHLGPRKCFRFDTDASTHTIGASWVT